MLHSRQDDFDSPNEQEIKNEDMISLRKRRFKTLIFISAIAAVIILTTGIVFLAVASRGSGVQVVDVPAGTDIVMLVNVTLAPQTNPPAINTKPDLKVKESKDTILTLGSEKKLLELLKPKESLLQPQAYTALDVAAAQTAPNSFSLTNTQVEGVDEADIVKTDGKYIYSLKNQSGTNPRLTIAKVMEDGKLSLVNNIFLGYTSKGYSNARDLYLGQNTITVIGSSYDSMNTIVSVYGISDPEAPLSLLKYLEIEGNYNSSRKVGNQVYLITQKNVSYYGNDTSRIQPPLVRNNPDGQYTAISYNDVKYFPDIDYTKYLSVSGIDTSNMDQSSQIATFLCSGENIYSTTDSLYIINYLHANSISTKVCKFAYEDGVAVFKAKTVNLNGSVLNQYSMDEYNGIFRVAMTSRNNKGQQTTNVYLFDSTMKNISSIEDISPGESVFSVRFMGNMGYVVTSVRFSDPLFVLDLSDSKAPKVLGELKIPGFSTYLHPYDETHVIGVGQGGSNGDRTFKMSMFDVSDPANPKEMFSTDICSIAGTNFSFNPKSFFFDAAKGCIAIPAAGHIKDDKTNYFYYTNSVYVYSVDLINGFTLKSRIDIRDSQNMYDENVRELYINNMFYVVTEDAILAYNYDTFDFVQKLN